MKHVHCIYCGVIDKDCQCGLHNADNQTSCINCGFASQLCLCDWEAIENEQFNRELDDAEQTAIDSEHASELYPKATIELNSMGHLEIWDYAPVTYDPALLNAAPRLEGWSQLPESTIYVQGEQDVESVLEMLTAEERKAV